MANVDVVTIRLTRAFPPSEGLYVSERGRWRKAKKSLPSGVYKSVLMVDGDDLYCKIGKQWLKFYMHDSIVKMWR